MLEIFADKRSNFERQLEDILAMQRERDQVEGAVPECVGRIEGSRALLNLASLATPSEQ